MEKKIIGYKVESSNIKKIAYDLEVERLFVTFTSGSEYAYENVPKEIVCNLLFSDSIGKTFHDSVKSKYNCNTRNACICRR